MTTRSELVTAALLGTDRRPLATVSAADLARDPALVLLEQAARSSAAVRAGAILTRQPEPELGPAERLPLASTRAQDLIGQLLLRPQPALVDVCLATAARRGLGLAPEHWPAMAAMATLVTEVSRPTLGAVLGPRGRWFVAQNPRWARLAGALSGGPAPTATKPPAIVEPAIVEQEDVLRDPESIFTAADPWPPGLTEAVLVAIGNGRISRPGGYAAAVGARVPPDHYPLVRSAAEFCAAPERAAVSWTVRDAFAVLDRTVYLRVEIQHAFETDPIVFDHQERL